MKTHIAMTHIELPPALNRAKAPDIGEARQITIIGGNGAGKSLFMEEMINRCGPKAYRLNALSAFYPETSESTEPGSIDTLYRDAIRQQSYMRTDAVSQLDKITYMLFADELESLLLSKREAVAKGGKPKFHTTKLDIIRRHWERIFPGNRISRLNGLLSFSNQSGKDAVNAHALSQGEKTVLYYLGAVLFAMPEAVIFIDSPTLFVHPSITSQLWDTIEGMRPDCKFVYNSVDIDFVNTRTGNVCIWVKRYDSKEHSWEYNLIDQSSPSEELLMDIAGSRKPVLFIEGDAFHSIDARLYGLVFSDWTVRPLGSCNKVIEATRTFNDLNGLHKLRSMGIVDRDRRNDVEVDYLRKRNILVPDVAEVENIFLLPEVIRVMARSRGRDAAKIVRRVEKEVMRMFRRLADQQALQHVRHRVKREVECKIDAKFSCITALETHLATLPNKLQPRRHYNRLREKFAAMIRDNDYPGVLRVFNHKPALSDCGVHQLLGYHSKEDYITGVLETLKGGGKDAETIRNVIKFTLHAANADEPNRQENEEKPAGN